MAWVYLVLAGIFEVIWSTAMKESHGFTRLIPTIITAFFMLLSVALLAIAMKYLPLGTAYTVWVGIGAIGAFILGVIMFGESLNPMRVIAVLLIFSGVVLLKLATKG
ncbi:DMT family transporter [Ewingella americana]|jgi:quaternary ammonium compound-resistance protein SugE|uniref:Guanidinium exporter n=1 Tax=Ewingella americana TaxID=41202 RepID=A0A502G8Y8_9GAMM|nr:multidrug efflux SMR transporter [Ewingella americana]TPG58398.1 QacE family quaternary ammonium compound efflux SMR transporter [Ewingella americana]